MASIAASSIGTISSTFLVGGHGSSSHNLFFLLKSSTIRSLAFRRRLQAQPTPLETIDVDKVVNGDTGLNKNRKILACPICYLPLSVISDGILNVGWESMANLQCSCCRKTYYRKESHVELIAASGAKTYNEPMPIATEFFRKLILVRADISRLPFVAGSIDVVHAGAAIHCWPSPSSAVAEISRVLKPGGVFVGTTYILDGPFNAIPFLKAIRQNVSEFTGAYSFLSEGELEDICQACGLEGFTCVRNRQFVMFSATKPL
ncbi:Uncharacterized methyltransferase At1g78140, chloroplastic [Linum perenne]